MNRVQTVFRMISQLSLVADASTHSDKEMLVSCAFSPNQDLGCHAPVQHLNTGSLKPSEVDISTLARIAKNRKLQRMSAFRQLQAIDHQLVLLSGNRLGLDAFSLKNVAEEENEEEMPNEKKENQKRPTLKVVFQLLLMEGGPSIKSILKQQVRQGESSTELLSSLLRI